MSRELTLRILGMHCSGCVGSVEKALRGVEGVAGAAVQLMTESASVSLARDDVPAGRLIAAVRAAGYDAQVAITGHDLVEKLAGDSDLREKLRRHRQEIIQAMMYALPVIALDHFRHVLWPGAAHSQVSARLLQIALLVMLMCTAGAPILVGGLRALVHRAPNMDLLISLGVVVSFVSSLYGVFIARDDAFVHLHAAAMILALVIFGRYLETRARSRATAAMSALAKRAVKTALVKRTPKPTDSNPWVFDNVQDRADQYVETSFDDIEVGDLVRVRSGGAIPTDGVIVDGQAGVDESLMTGEPLPHARRIGDTVLGGAVVTEGTITIKATAIADQSTLGRIVQLVARAQSGRTRMQSQADRIAAIFTPIIVAIAAITFVGWLMLGSGTGGGTGVSPVWFMAFFGAPAPGSVSDATRAAVAVLVVACPCALGLATPTVVAVASGLAALRGILVRDAAMLEAMGGVDTVVWDKTGTLTTGSPMIRWIDGAQPPSAVAVEADFSDTKPVGAGEPARPRADPLDRNSVLALAASAELFSTHPIGKAIEAQARRESIELTPPTAFDLILGGGVSARIGERDVLVGSPRFLESRGIDGAQPPSAVSPDPRETLITVAVDGRVAAWIALCDTVRPSSAQAVERLRRLGVSSELLTGDAASVAQAVAQEVGITIVAAESSPEDKVARVAQLRAAGRKVAMVGDGVNDAAALAAANVGVAFATGADVACEAAGVNLIGSTPHLVADAVVLARGSLKIIRQNLFWAFIYNALMIPLAAFGKLPPSVAAGAMMISSLTVVLNALRLSSVIGWKTPRHGESPVETC